MILIRVLFDCLIKLEKFRYIILRLSTPDHIRVTDKACIAESSNCGPDPFFRFNVFNVLERTSLDLTSMQLVLKCHCVEAVTNMVFDCLP